MRRDARLGCAVVMLVLGVPAWAQPGGTWSAVGGGTNAAVNAMAVWDLGQGPALYCGVDTVGLEYALKLVNGTGVYGIGFNGICPGFPPCSSPRILALAIFDDGTGPALYAAVAFALGAPGAFSNGVARWGGPGASGALLGGSIDGVEALVVFDDGSGPALYAGGSNNIGTAGYVAQWSGTTWLPLGAGVSGPVKCLAVHDDGGGAALFAGGSFTMAGGGTVSGIARWDGTAWAPLGSGVGGVNPTVSALEVFDDGSGPALFAGGAFTLAGALGANHIARWDGASWTPLGVGLSGGAPMTVVDALEVFDDGAGPALHAGGAFTMAGGSPSPGIARWDGSAWSSLGAGIGASALERVSVLGVYADPGGPALYAGGSFTVAGGVPAMNIARWSTGSTISVTFTQAGPGAAVFVNGANLTPGREYHNLFSLEPCSAGAGSGPYLGLCATTPMGLQFLIDQVSLPLGTPPFHFIAASGYQGFGPFTLPPLTLEAVCFEFSAFTIGPVSAAVASFVVQ